MLYPERVRGPGLLSLGTRGGQGGGSLCPPTPPPHLTRQHLTWETQDRENCAMRGRLQVWG